MAYAAKSEGNDVRLVPTAQRNLVVTQANALAQGIQDMDLYEARLVRTLIAVLDRRDNEFPMVRIYVPDLCRLFGISNSNSVHGKLKRATKSIMSKVAFVEHGHGSWKAFNWIALAEYVSGTDSESGIGYVDMQLHGQLREFLLQLKSRFFSYPLRHVTQMRSEYAIRVFELLLADSFNGKKRVLQYEVNDLRKRLKAEHYKDFKDFRKNVLEMAQRECERVTNLAFEYEKVTRGRRVVALEFKLDFRSPPNDLALIDTDVTEEDVVQRVALQNELLAAGFTAAPGPIIDRLGLKRVRRVFERCREDAKRLEGTEKAIRNLGGYIHSQLQRELDMPAPVTGVDAMPPLFGGDDEVTLTLREVSSRGDELHQAWASACGAFEAEVWEALSEEAKATLEKQAREILPKFTLRHLDEHGWRSSGPIVAAARRDAMLHAGIIEYPSRLSNLRSFAEAEGLLRDVSEEDRERVMLDASEKYLEDG